MTLEGTKAEAGYGQADLVETGPRILGLDLSLTASGWAMGQVGGVFRPPNGMRGPERLAWLSDRVLDKCRFPRGEQAEKLVDLVAIEGYAYSRGTSGVVLGELGGVVRYRLYRAGIGYVELGPGVWRKAVLGKGNLAKDQVRVEALKRYGIEFPDLNTLEAWGVAMGAWLQMTGASKPAIRRSRRG